MNYKQACLKRDIELTLIYPLIIIGKLIAHFFPLKEKSSYFLFFPSFDIGGSPKVNADIVSILKNNNPIIILSKKPHNNGFKELFLSHNCKVIDLHKIIDNKIFHFMNIIYRGIISTWINNSVNPIVFGGECMYFYKIIPHLKKSIYKIELSHLNTWLNYNQSFIKYINIRIVSTPKLKRYLESQYQINNVPSDFLKRIIYIDNWVEIPECELKNNFTLNVLFVGRGAPQKRVHLVSAIAENIIKSNKEITFTFVGDVLNIVSEYVKKNCKIFEFITNQSELNLLYDTSDVLILTSAFEGLPIVVMDMMARGKVVISTAVDGIPDYITHRESGLLIYELTDENKIIDCGVKLINELNKNRALLQSLGINAKKIAQQKFDKKLFEEKYKSIFNLKD